MGTLTVGTEALHGIILYTKSCRGTHIDKKHQSQDYSTSSNKEIKEHNSYSSNNFVIISMKKFFKSSIYIYESRGEVYATRYIIISRECIFVKEGKVSGAMIVW